MIKRLLTSAAIISAALSANADTFDMLPSFGSSGWGDSTYDAETKTTPTSETGQAKDGGSNRPTTALSMKLSSKRRETPSDIQS